MGVYLNPGNEWDCILRDKSYHADDQKRYLDFIRNLLKDKAYVALAYMTGILPIKKYGTHSIPNTEIRGEFRNAVTGEHWKEVATALETSDRLLQETWDGDAETVAELLAKITGKAAGKRFACNV